MPATMPKFTGKRVLVVGLGLLGGGVGSATFLAEEGAAVTVTDLKTKAELSSALDQLKRYKIHYRLGQHSEKDLEGVDFILRNPAVPRDAPILKAARRQKIPIEMDASLFLKLLGHCTVIGITGTRGKTTTATLLAEIFKASGQPVVLGGNIPGGSMLSLIRSIKRRSTIILELSSWQLQGFAEAKISPATSIITNIFPDHLNRYASMEAYVQDKKAIFKFQTPDGVLFLNRDDAFTPEFRQDARGSVHLFSAQDLPQSWNLRLLGEHNRVNAAAAKAVADAAKLDPAVIEKTVTSFPGIAHRLEVVRTIRNVTYINDSASTMPEATIAAIRSFTQPIVLIAGGNDKNLTYTTLGRLINRRVKALILLEGNGTEKLARVVKKERIRARTMSLPRALGVAHRVASPGDVVLFSPAFTSFGLFQNEFQRGEKFKESVRKLQ